MDTIGHKKAQRIKQVFLSSFYLLLLCSLYSTEWNGRTEALSHGAVQLLEAKKRSFREDDGSNEDICSPLINKPPPPQQPRPPK